MRSNIFLIAGVVILAGVLLAVPWIISTPNIVESPTELIDYYGMRFEKLESTINLAIIKAFREGYESGYEKAINTNHCCDSADKMPQISID